MAATAFARPCRTRSSCPSARLARGGGVAGVQRGGGLADVAGDVDEVDQDGHFQAAFPGMVMNGGDLLLVPVDEEDPLADPLRVAAVGLVECRPDHRGDVPGDRGRYPLVPGGGAGVRLAAGGRGGDVLRRPDGGGEVGDGDDLGHLLDPGMRRIAVGRAVLRAHRDALAVSLHHDHVAVRKAGVRVAGALSVEIAGPGGQVRGQAELGAADRDPGAGLDDFLGLPVPAGSQVEGRQGAHAQGVRVLGQVPPRVSGIQVRLAAVAVCDPADPHRPEDAGQAPAVPGLGGAVPDPGSARDLRHPLLPRAVQG